MHRLLAVTVVGLSAAISGQAATALVYVPGEHRSDGVYIPPHFRGETKRPTDDAWFERLGDRPGEIEKKVPRILHDEARAGRPAKRVTR